MKRIDFKNLGFGLGLRPPHFEAIYQGKSTVDWFEALTENYIGLRGSGAGRPLEVLKIIRKNYPIVLHGVSLSLGSSDPLNQEYLKQLKNLVEIIEPEWISDHLCWTSLGGHNLHDLLPLPYTFEGVKHVSERIQKVQDFLGRRILIENVSSYVEFKNSEMEEWDFLREIVNRADCGILLDVNNIYVSVVNHGISAEKYINEIPLQRVGQIHLAGHTDKGDYLIDTHDEKICDPVWNLYQEVIKKIGPVSTMIERDDNIPPLSELEEELSIAKRIVSKLTKGEPDAVNV